MTTTTPTLFDAAAIVAITPGFAAARTPDSAATCSLIVKAEPREAPASPVRSGPRSRMVAVVLTLWFAAAGVCATVPGSADAKPPQCPNTVCY
jgi:hypothetical protein